MPSDASTREDWLVVTTKPGRQTRELIERAESLAGELVPARDPAEEALSRLRRAVELMIDDLAMAHLASIELERIKDIAPGGLHYGRLRSAGLTTVLDVLRDPNLQRHPGVGDKTAREARGAAHQMATLARDNVRFQFDVDAKPSTHGQVLQAVFNHQRIMREAPQLLQRAAEWATALRDPVPAARLATSRIGFFFRSKGKAETIAAVGRLEQLVNDPSVASLVDAIRSLPNPLVRDVWKQFEADAASVYSHLDEHTDLDLGSDREGGSLPAEIIEAVRKQPLDTAHLTVSLRGYQSFGARYALVQQRTLLGDEMGLGKTVTALAVAGHLASVGSKRVLTVCPASVLHNWIREVHGHTRLQGWVLHGPDRRAQLGRWQQRGGVAVTTFDTLRSLGHAVDTDLLVVDEAHYVKNRSTIRAQSVSRWSQHAGRVLYMTGTPLENTVAEFRSLVGQLQPEVEAKVGDAFAFAGTESFRERVAPVYLRRNQEDVLTELPDRLEIHDWVEMTVADENAYRAAVRAKNFMAMRRAAWDNAGSAPCAKMERLEEILAESAAEGWKTVVFSYFLNTLERVAAAVDLPVFGPLTGSVPPSARQVLVDDFSEHRGPAVLVSQIRAGGVGLNIQSASVVVLAEPQWKPATEEQAIARCHRMGQTRRVHVHRLLTEPGVDLRMVELLAEKAKIFNEYVRQSSIAEQAEDATDQSHVAMAQQIIDEERDRLGLEDDPNRDPVLF